MLKRSTIATAALTVLLCAGVGVAAYVIYTQTVGGTATSQFSTAPSMDSLTVAPNGTPDTFTPGQTAMVPVKVTNNTGTNVSVSASILPTVTFSTDKDGSANCSSYLSLANGGGNVLGAGGILAKGTAYGSTETKQGTLPVAVSSSAPGGCSSANVTMTFAGVAG